MRLCCGIAVYMIIVPRIEATFKFHFLCLICSHLCLWYHDATKGSGVPSAYQRMTYLYTAASFGNLYPEIICPTHTVR